MRGELVQHSGLAGPGRAKQFIDTACVVEAADGFPRQPNLPGDRSDSRAFVLESCGRLESQFRADGKYRTLLTGDVNLVGGLPPLFRWGALDRGSRLNIGLLSEAIVLGCNLFLHCLREVVPQMPTVGDLDRLRRPNTGGFGIRVGAITADHLGGRMNGEPFGDGAGFPVGENIDWTVSIQIDQNGPIPMPSPQREIVDTEHRDQSFRRTR